MVPPPIKIRSRSGSPFFQNLVAIASLMTTTGREDFSSVSANVLPRFTGILNTSKYPGETVTHPAPPVTGELFAGGLPTMLKPKPYPPSSGIQHVALARSEE